jgi:hypothetical protein
MIKKFKNVKNYRWLERYLKFIEIFKRDGIYKNQTHNHHILPRSLYPEFEDFNKNPWNKAILTYREHLIAHYMLAKALEGNMWFAYNNMNAYGERLNSILYEKAMIRISKEQSKRQKEWLKNNEHPKGMLGKKHTKDALEKMSNWSSQNYEERYGVEKSNEIKDKLSRYERTPEHNKKISIAKMGHIVTDEQRKKQSNTIRRKILSGERTFSVSEEHSEKISNTLKEKYKTEEHHTKGKTYEEIMGKEKAGKLRKNKSENNPSKRQEVKDKISKANKGKPKSDEHKKKISELVWMNNGTKNKRSKPNEIEKWLLEGWKLGKVKLTCPYCKKETDQSNYKQWHGKNCKLKR